MLLSISFTFLQVRGSSLQQNKSKLWGYIEPNSNHGFTLVYKGQLLTLPKSLRSVSQNENKSFSHGIVITKLGIRCKMFSPDLVHTKSPNTFTSDGSSDYSNIQ
jgi:hypothetical protein